MPPTPSTCYHRLQCFEEVAGGGVRGAGRDPSWGRGVWAGPRSYDSLQHPLRLLRGCFSCQVEPERRGQ